MPVTDDVKAALGGILSPDEIIEPSSSRYHAESQTWAHQRQLNPALVLRPTSAEKLQKLVPYLYDAPDLDFAIRSGGAGSSSSRDIVVSMSAFDAFDFDAKAETAIIGAGQTWGEVDRKAEEHAPGYVLVSTRVPYVGVGGSVLSGGISWISSEYGLASDPQNLLDVEIVLRDGRKIWASTEPDLLWALRGGGGNFGVATAFKMKCYQYTTSIFTGAIAFPAEALDAVSHGLSNFVTTQLDPKVLCHVLIGATDESGEKSGQDAWVSDVSDNKPSAPMGKARLNLSIFVFDAHGEEHGRSEAGFKWALDIPGAVDMTSVRSLRGVNRWIGDTSHLMGLTNSYMNAALVHDIDAEFVIRGWNWVEKVVSEDPRMAPGTLWLLEIMQKNAFGTIQSPDKKAWPHPTAQHVLQLLTGFMPTSGCTEELALMTLENAPKEIKGSHSPASFFPNFLEQFNNVQEIFGVNYDKLRQIKKLYDPNSKLKGPMFPPA